MADNAALLASLYDIQQKYSSTQTTIDANAPRCTVDVTNRTINIPKNVDSLGVQYDHRSKAVYFEIDRFVNDVDLLTQTCVVQWINGDIEKGNMGFYPIILYDNSISDKLTLIWEIHDESTQIAGDLHFALRFYTLNDNRTFDWSFNTLPAKSIIKDTLDVQMESTIEIQPSVLSIWNYRIASLERMATEAVEEAANSALEAQAWAVGNTLFPERALDNSKYYKELTQAIYDTTNNELHERVYNEGKKIADKLWLIPDEETIVRLDEEYTIGVPTATTEKKGVVIVGNGIKIKEDIISVDTGFNKAENLEELTSEEKFESLLAKLAKAVSEVIVLDENAVLKAMISDINVNDDNKIPTSSYVYKLAERIGIDTNLIGDSTLTDGVNKLPEIRNDVDSLISRLVNNPIEDANLFFTDLPLGLTIFNTTESTLNLPSDEDCWKNAVGLLIKLSDIEGRIILFNKQYSQIASMSYVGGILDEWSIGVCKIDIDNLNDTINLLNTNIINIEAKHNALSNVVENNNNEHISDVENLNIRINTVETNYIEADNAINNQITSIQTNHSTLLERIGTFEESIEKSFENINSSISNTNNNFNNYDTSLVVDEKIEDLKEYFDNNIKNYETIDSVNTKLDTQATNFNSTLESYAKTEFVNTQISNLETSTNGQIETVNGQIETINEQINDVNEKFKDYSTTKEIDEQFKSVEDSLADYMPLTGGVLQDAKITAIPSEDNDIVNKAYVDTTVSEAIQSAKDEINPDNTVVATNTISLVGLGDAELVINNKFLSFIFSGETSMDFNIVEGETSGTEVIGMLPEGIEVYNDVFERVIYIMGYGACLLSIINGEISLTYEQSIPTGTTIKLYEIITLK